MPQYSYTIINADNQELNGTINAPDEAAARNELSSIGSVLTLNTVSENASAAAEPAETDVISAETEAEEEENEQIIKYDFEAIDKNGKKVVGTIQGEDIYSIYKRLVQEYQFDVSQLYPDNLSPKDKGKAQLRGLDDLKDKLTEEKMVEELDMKKQELNQIEFEKKQKSMKSQVDFVLEKVSAMLKTYSEELDPTRKSKIKYYVEKILRIKNSTNLDYIRQTCEEMLTYLQKEEIFLNHEQRIKEKTRLSIEAKSMMMELNRINKPPGKDIFESLREWRTDRITNNTEPTSIDRLIDILITPLIGSVPEDDEIIELRNRIHTSNGQLKEFVIIYFQAPDQEFKTETKQTLLRLWEQRKQEKKALKQLIQQKHDARTSHVRNTSMEILEKEIFGVAGWVLAFYIAYYFLTIYLNSKDFSFIPDTKLNLLFQTAIVKYFFTTLFFFVCFLGIKIEFFRRKPLITPVLFVLFFFCSSLIILNF
jgi:hypothetical protein